ncbi:unnamed protein product [Auanema sp. JU1783]|nr:unnamed protein product [Auanema sp. JU1783]
MKESRCAGIVQKSTELAGRDYSRKESWIKRSCVEYMLELENDMYSPPRVASCSWEFRVSSTDVIVVMDVISIESRCDGNYQTGERRREEPLYRTEDV